MEFIGLVYGRVKVCPVRGHHGHRVCWVQLVTRPQPYTPLSGSWCQQSIYTNYRIERHLAEWGSWKV